VETSPSVRYVLLSRESARSCVPLRTHRQEWRGVTKKRKYAAGTHSYPFPHRPNFQIHRDTLVHQELLTVRYEMMYQLNFMAIFHHSSAMLLLSHTAHEPHVYTTHTKIIHSLVCGCGIWGIHPNIFFHVLRDEGDERGLLGRCRGIRDNFYGFPTRSSRNSRDQELIVGL